MTLARGFLAESEDLRRSATEPAGASALFVDTFRLVAGIVLIAVAEDRDLLHPMWVPLGPRRRYAVELSVRRPPAELRWSALERLSTALKAGDPEVGLAAIATGEDGGLLNSRGVLERATIADAALSAGILALAPPDAPQRGARWAALAMGLGQVYEQLQGLVPVLVGGVFDLVEPARASGSAHRHDAGAYYTPAALVDHMLDTLLDPPHDTPHDTPHAVAVLDPSCGSGNFLLAAAQRIAAAQISGGTGSGGTGSGGTGAVYGVDIDPVAVELCRASLWLLRGQSGLPLCTFDHQVRCADALLADWEALFPAVHAAGGFDVIVGNPPYLNQLETGTAASQDRLKQLKSRFGASKGAYTDEATLFLLLGLDLLGPGGRMALLHPLSLLAARDAEVARSRLASSCSIGSIWLTTEHIFAAASVYVCAVTFHKDFDRPQGRTVTRSWGNEFRSGPSIDVCMDDLA
ncbi:MAG: hypothetical protein EXR69_16420, partial [Myxococcales bacterium]|nr:hypothetical protein [Myxococcales bacterium]